MSDKAPQLTLTRPADRSLAAYQTWVRDLCHALNPAAANDLTPAEWATAWRTFWASAPTPNEANRGIDTLPAARPAAAP